MSRTDPREASRTLRSAFETLEFWVELTLLTLFGPAQLDEAHDPVAQLRRGRREHRPNMHWVG
jgi:hypothetical protein